MTAPTPGTTDLEPAAGAPPKPVALGVAAVFFAVAWTVFGAGLGGPFVYDDLDAIVENETLTSFGAALSPPADTSFAGRPLVNLSMALDRALFGLEPASVHRTNLLLHVLCVLLGVEVLRRTLAGPRLALAGAGWTAVGAGLLALVHPLNSEVCYYASPRTELVLAVWFLGASYCVARRVTGGGNAWVVGAAACAWLGALSKEVMAVVPLVAFGWVAIYFAVGWKDAWRRHRNVFLALASSWIPLAVLVATTPRSQSVGFAIAGGPLDYLKAQCLVLPAYLVRVVWPRDLVFDYGMLLPVSWSEAAPGFAFLLLAFVGACVLTWKRPALGFPALFAFVVLGPSSSVVPIVTEIGADRRVYLPLFVALATFVTLVARATNGRVALGVAAALAVPLGLLSHARGDDYATRLALWQSVVDARPDNVRALYNVAEEQAKAGRFEEARVPMARAAEIFHGEASVRQNHGMILTHLGRFEEALGEFEAAGAIDPTSVAARDGQLRALVALGRRGEAQRRLDGWPLDERLRATAAQLGLAVRGGSR